MAGFLFAGDDDGITVFDGETPGVENGGVVSELSEAAEDVQRMVVSRVAREYGRGSMDFMGPAPGLPTTRERRFHVPQLIEWQAGAPDVVVEALRAGRVRARLNARMGLGKSTKLAPYIANELGYRVLVVSVDSVPMRQSARFMRDSGLGKVRATWGVKREARVVQMTYADFWSVVRGPSRGTFFSSFEVMIFDEAFVADEHVYAAKACFAVYGGSECSLLLCSATMREGGPDDLKLAASAASGTFMHLEQAVSVETAISEGKLLSKFLVDRTQVLVPRDSHVLMLREHYEEGGVETRILDSASTGADVREVNEWMTGDSVSPRVVICQSSFGIAVNLKVSYSIIWPYRSATVEVDGVWQEVDVPMTEQMVAQAMSRTGRGLVSGSGGLIMSPERSEHADLYPDRAAVAYVKLSAAGIMPAKGKTFESVGALFPNGLAAEVADNLMKVCLPPEIALRYMTSRGRFSKKYVTGLNLFAQPGHYLIGDDEDLDESGWVTEACTGYFSAGVDADAAVVSVPVRATGELQVVLHAISAVSRGVISLARWAPQSYDEHDYAYESSGDEASPRARRTALAPRRITYRQPESPPAVVTRKHAIYDFPSVPVEDRRDGVASFGPRVQEALASMRACMEDYEVPSPAIDISIGDAGGGLVDVPFGVVESPGGSPIGKLSVGVCRLLNTGQHLSAEQLLEVIMCAKPDPARFVMSRVFDSFGGAWDSFLRSVLVDSVAGHVISEGESTTLYKVVDFLRGRLNKELVMALASSNIHKRKFLKIFPYKPKPEAVFHEIQNGVFKHVAQSTAFFARVLQLKRLVDDVLIRAERNNQWLPRHIAASQRVRFLGSHGRKPGIPLVGALSRSGGGIRGDYMDPPSVFDDIGTAQQTERLGERFRR